MKRNRRIVALALGALVAALAGLLFVLVPYDPILIVGPTIEDSDLSLADPVPGLRLHVFNTGANRMSSLLVGPAPPWRAAPAFVIEHPNQGLIAYDLGLSHEVAEHGEKAISPPVGWLMESRGRPGLTLEAQMREAGLSPDAVETVVISHLHEDHTGVADEFAQAVFIGGPGTRERAIEGGHAPFHSGVSPEWREIAFGEEGIEGAGFQGEGTIARIGPFDSGIDLFGDGSVLLIATGGGHTSEDLMALVNLASGPVLLTGDAVVHFDWLASDDVERIASDPERAAVVRNRVRSLRDSGAALIIPGHDLRQLGAARPDLILHHPERFEPSAWPIEQD
jgi:N-acyl homoserine lactone hydrolase